MKLISFMLLTSACVSWYLPGDAALASFQYSTPNVVQYCSAEIVSLNLHYGTHEIQ